MRAPLEIHGPVSVKVAGSFPQFGFIDLLKAVAAQLIVLHHLAFYGPMSDHVQPVLPDLMGWLSSHARIAVQVFLVIGGFLAARSLASQAKAGELDVVGMVKRRYLKLAPPFMAATGIAVCVSACVSMWMTHDSISSPPGFLQLAAHALFLHGVLDYESLWAGAWYVAIDFQLYALLTLMFWGAARLTRKRAMPWLMPAMVMTGMCAALLHFNRDAAWDSWAVYFFGSYGLGVLACWASEPGRSSAMRGLLLAAMVVPTVFALEVDFRTRIAVALTVACALALLGRRQLWGTGRWATLVSKLGRESYSIFLVHFPVCLLVNAVFINLAPAEPLFQGAGMIVAWFSCLLAGSVFHRRVEAPLGRLSGSAISGWGRRVAARAAAGAGTSAGHVVSFTEAARKAAFTKSRKGGISDGPSHLPAGTYPAPGMPSNEEAYRYRDASRRGRAGG